MRGRCRRNWAWPKIVLMNDLGANGAQHRAFAAGGILRVESGGKPEPGGTRALLAAGTGLGQSILVWDGARYRICSVGRAGHSDFAPHTEQQIELLRFYCGDVTRKWSWELIFVRARVSHATRISRRPEVKHAVVRRPGRPIPRQRSRRKDWQRLARFCRRDAGFVDLDLWGGSRESGAEGAGAGRRIRGGRGSP